MKLDLDDVISSFSYVVADENVLSVKWHNRLGHIGKDRMNMLTK